MTPAQKIREALRLLHAESPDTDDDALDLLVDAAEELESSERNGNSTPC